jgi:electron transfer flavoprotein beta subunit
MKIVVAVRQVVDIDEEFELTSDGLSVDPAFVERDVNEWDNYSLEEALSLKDATGAEVIAVTVGDEEAEDALRACLAKGADRAVHVESAADGLSDPLTTARLLAAVVEREAPDLVLCGVQSSDTVNGATGTALAALSDLSCVAVVRAITLSDAADVSVERELEGGSVEVLELSLPAVLTIQTGINKPRYATLRQLKQAKDKPLDVLSLGDLEVDPDGLAQFAGARLRRLQVPQHEATAQILDGDAATVAARISEIIAERLN